jgi:hypothetical protein
MIPSSKEGVLVIRADYNKLNFKLTIINSNCSFIFSGITIINHNTMNLTDVAHCVEPGCDPHPITYQASEKQMKALIDLSQECSQSVSVNKFRICF